MLLFKMIGRVTVTVQLLINIYSKGISLSSIANHSSFLSPSLPSLCPPSLPPGGGDIVNPNLKLILGLIWTLILHYQISIGFGLDDAQKGSNAPTPKQALINYLQVCVCVCMYACMRVCMCGSTTSFMLFHVTSCSPRL